MATFLTTRKMSPELAARIQSSVTGKNVEPGSSLSARSRAISRIVIFGVVIALVWAFISAKKRDRKTFDHDRAALADSLALQSQALPQQKRDTVIHVEAILVHFAGTYDGDMKDPRALAALDSPAIWVRGPIDSFVSTRRIAPAASSSRKDALLACLVAPPAGRTEKAISSIVQLAFAGGAPLDLKTPSVLRLDDAEIALPFFEPAWAARVRAAESENELAVYKHEIEKAGLERGARALRAETLIVAMDEPPAPGGVTELDGERPHDIRLAIVDIGTGEYLFRTRKHVDPTGWSEWARTQWASGLDGCRFAQDARAVLAAP